jgi:hypothetical protein
MRRAEQIERYGPLGIDDCLAAFRRVTDLIGLNRGFPEIDRRIDIVAGHVVVGSIGSNQTRNITRSSTIPGIWRRAA